MPVRKGVPPMLDGDSTHMILVAPCHTTFAFYDSTINRAVSPTPRAANLILGLVTLTCNDMILSGMEIPTRPLLDGRSHMRPYCTPGRVSVPFVGVERGREDREVFGESSEAPTYACL